MSSTHDSTSCFTNGPVNDTAREMRSTPGILPTHSIMLLNVN